MANPIEDLLNKELFNPNSYFVFPTQTALELWADRIISINNIKAVAMERFIAWDKFKSESIRSAHQNKQSVPSVMRTIFAASLIKENQDKPFLKYIINQEYKESSGAFTQWIASILPGLNLWKIYYDKNKTLQDSEDSDLLEIYNKYKNFLDSNNLFDPAWEVPPFKKDQNHYFIFYPEILSDYIEYKNLLESSEDITIIHLDQNNFEQPKGYLYNNTRTELKQIASYLKTLHDTHIIEWDKIAISVPDLENYSQYIDRELTINEIPHVIKYSLPLTKSKGGNLFSNIYDCYSKEFNYSSVNTLLNNFNFPWKSKDVILQLLKFGQLNHCICNFTNDNKKVDIWNESFKNFPQEELAKTFYEKLKTHITRLVTATSFSKIREYYFSFKEEFFNMEECNPHVDKIISRCLTELASLIDLEKDFPQCKVESPFSFFNTYLSTVSYLEQTQKTGVQVLPYKTACCAPFDCHIILDSGAQSLSVVYKELSFLREDKRKFLLNKEDPNVTEFFIQLYKMNSLKKDAYFTASIQTLTGYAQLSSYLQEEDLSKENLSDTYKNEKNFYLNNEPFPKEIALLQKDSFLHWVQNQNNSTTDSKVLLQEIKKNININQLTYSESQLKTFTECPRKWLYERLLKIKQDDDVAVLADKYTQGNICHKIFELLFNYLKTNNITIRINQETNEIDSSILDKLKDFIEQSIISESKYYITKELLLTAKETIYSDLKNSLLFFFKKFTDCKVISTEEELKCNTPISLTGRSDCLLQDIATGEYILVDFKSTKSGFPDTNKKYTSEDPDCIPDFQIPLYVHLYKNCANPKEIENACYYSIAEQDFSYMFGKELYQKIKNPHSKFKEITKEEFDLTIKKVLEETLKIDKKIKDLDLSLSEKQEYSKCTKCNFINICRRIFTVRGQK